ncbi:MAG: hypothetical protein JNM27_01150 [Leptospirales bacterium]|nr:hypothetical protein [Leptospirales bacterium]
MRMLKIGLFLLLAGIGGILAQDEFVPGDSEIKEANILSSMERELGQDFTPKPVAARESLIRPDVPTPSITFLSVKLRLSGEAEASGQLQSAVSETISISSLNEGSLPTNHNIPLMQLSTLEFRDWQPGRITTLQNGRQEVLLFPTGCTAERIDGSRIVGRINPLDWLQINMVSGDSVSAYRSYFKIERQAGETTPAVKEPPKGTVTRILIMHEKGEESNAASLPR